MNSVCLTGSPLSHLMRFPFLFVFVHNKKIRGWGLGRLDTEGLIKLKDMKIAADCLMFLPLLQEILCVCMCFVNAHCACSCLSGEWLIHFIWDHLARRTNYLLLYWLPRATYSSNVRTRHLYRTNDLIASCCLFLLSSKRAFRYNYVRFDFEFKMSVVLVLN